MTTRLQCLACGEVRTLGPGANACGCGRSVARLEGSVVELQGPGRVLVPADGITVDGLPWAALPEEPVVVRRAA